MRDATIATSLLIDFLAFLGRRGLAQALVCQAAQIDPAWLQAPHARVPAAAMARLWAVGEQLTGDADLGLHSAESYNPGALSIVGYVVLSCASAAQALDRLARYAPLLNEGLQVQLQHQQGLTHCSFGAAPGIDSFLRRSPRQAVETLAAGIVLTLGRLATRPPQPLRVLFQHAAPASTAEHRRLLGPAVLFGQAQNAVVYDSAALDSGMLSADPGLLQMFEGDAGRRLQALQAQHTVSARVLAVVSAGLKGEVPSLASVAAALAMSERSLQRGLRDEASSFRDIVDQARKNLALQHLARPGTSATDVAFLLGFSEPSAFSRAFRRWTGGPPTQFRGG